MTCPDDDLTTTLSAVPELLDPEFGRSPFTPSRLLEDVEVADILLMTVEWVRKHAPEIPGFVSLGSYYRFRSVPVARWLGNLDRLLSAEEAARILSVPKTWVYANADQIPGVIRLGRYVRFRPRILQHFLEGSEVVQ